VKHSNENLNSIRFFSLWLHSPSLIQTAAIWTACAKCFPFFANARLPLLCPPVSLVDEVLRERKESSNGDARLWKVVSRRHS